MSSSYWALGHQGVIVSDIMWSTRKVRNVNKTIPRFIFRIKFVESDDRWHHGHCRRKCHMQFNFNMFNSCFMVLSVMDHQCRCCCLKCSQPVVEDTQLKLLIPWVYRNPYILNICSVRCHIIIQIDMGHGVHSVRILTFDFAVLANVNTLRFISLVCSPAKHNKNYERIWRNTRHI